MDNEEQSGKKKLIILLIVLIAITIILVVLNKKMDTNNKVLGAQDYVIEKETEYSKDESKGLLPVINLKGKEVETINNEILGIYYSVAYKEYDVFKYEYNIEKDILSLLITVTLVDDTEYGTIKYYSYNINVKENKSLSNQEVVKTLKLDSNIINEKLEFRIKKYYSLDVLNKTMSYDEYKELINYKKEDAKLYIKNKKLYAYITLGLTQGLFEYPGNINEILISEL